MEIERPYFDTDDNPCTIRQMIKRDPEWVASRFTFMEGQIAELEKQNAFLVEVRDIEKTPEYAAERKELLSSVNVTLTADNARLREALKDYGRHDSKCVAGQWRSGTPTEDGNYESLYGYGNQEVRCRRGEVPPCTCGMDVALQGENDD